MKSEFQVSYFLWKARADKNGFAPVYIRSKQNSEKQVSFNTGVKLNSQQWNKKKNEPKNKPASLIDLERKLKDTYQDLSLQGYEPDLTLLLEHFNDTRKPSGQSIIAWCDDYEKGQYSPGQKKAVRTVKSNVEAFHKSLTFDKLTKPRLKAFFEHLTANGVANNSQYKRLRALVNVCNHANIDCPVLFAYELPYEAKNAKKARLQWEEVKRIIDTEPMTQLEGVAKDVFLLACFSGLRISDILSLNEGKLHAMHYERAQTKTDEFVYVTIHGRNESLFKKYISTGVKYSRQRLSSALKEVLKRSELTEKVTKTQNVGYNRVKTEKEKWEEISFHSGRRFYSRLLNDLGLGGEIARDELGHSFKSVTELYSGSQEHALRVARVRKAVETMEATLEQLALMKVA